MQNMLLAVLDSLYQEILSVNQRLKVNPDYWDTGKSHQAVFLDDYLVLLMKVIV